MRQFDFVLGIYLLCVVALGAYVVLSLLFRV